MIGSLLGPAVGHTVELELEPARDAAQLEASYYQ